MYLPAGLKNRGWVLALGRARQRATARRRRRITREVERLRRLLPGMKLEKAILFGSAARAEVHARSDIDLILVMDTACGFAERAAQARRDLAPRVATDVLVYTPGEFVGLLETNPFVREAVAEGWLIYDSGCPLTGEGQAMLREKLPLPPSRVDPRAEGERWLAEAREELSVAEILQAAGHHGYACFHCQQAVEKALKAFLRSRSEHRVRTHSTTDLCARAAALEPDLAELAPAAAAVDDYYLSPRYPNGPRGRGAGAGGQEPSGPSSLAYRPAESARALCAARAVLEAVSPRLAGTA